MLQSDRNSSEIACKSAMTRMDPNTKFRQDEEDVATETELCKHLVRRTIYVMHDEAYHMN